MVHYKASMLLSCHSSCFVYFLKGISLDFVAGDLSGMEGEIVEACVVITSGSNQLRDDVNVVINAEDNLG